MTAVERATLEQLRQENQELRAQVAALEQTVRDLLDRNRQLQEKLDEQARAWKWWGIPDKFAGALMLLR